MPSKKTVIPREPHTMWTKDQLNIVVDLWESKSTRDIAEEIGLKKEQVGYIAYTLRKAGWPLPQKRKNGHIYSLILEVAADKKVKLSKKK